MEWRIIAKDGADLPSDSVRSAKAQLTITVGETYDVEFLTATAGDLLLDLLLPGQKIHTTQTLSFAPASLGASEAFVVDDLQLAGGCEVMSKQDVGG